MTSSSPNLRLVSDPPATMACGSPDCPLPAHGDLGLCAACEAVYGSLLVLCERVLARDLARLEHETPGITAAVRQAIAAVADPDVPEPSWSGAAEAPWRSLLPMPGELQSLRALLC